jgi:hypothetical protein
MRPVSAPRKEKPAPGRARVGEGRLRQDREARAPRDRVAELCRTAVRERVPLTRIRLRADPSRALADRYAQGRPRPGPQDRALFRDRAAHGPGLLPYPSQAMTGPLLRCSSPDCIVLSFEAGKKRKSKPCANNQGPPFDRHNPLKLKHLLLIGGGWNRRNSGHSLAIVANGTNPAANRPGLQAMRKTRTSMTLVRVKPVLSRSPVASKK